MADLSPQTRITIKVQKDQITYLANKTEMSYEDIKIRIRWMLEFIKKNLLDELIKWIDVYVPKRTGQLRELLKQWLNGSNIANQVLRIVIGTNLPYAGRVEGMETLNVRHTGEVGYVYYPNIFGIRGKVLLQDPSAVGHFFTELMKFAVDRAYFWVDQGKIQFGQYTSKSYKNWRSSWAQIAKGMGGGKP